VGSGKLFEGSVKFCKQAAPAWGVSWTQRTLTLPGKTFLRFRDLLRSEIGLTRRADLQKLLIEEEDRLGFSFEQLENIEQEIAKGDERIQWQRILVATMEREGRDATIAKALLENLTQIQTMYQRYRQTILAAIDRNRV
jgi:hypothetical protein